MPRHYYPGLQTKFQNLLRAAFRSDERFSGLAVPDKVRELGDQFQMSDEEIAFICKGTGNFLTAAKNAGTIMSFGTRRGYQLIDAAGPAHDGPDAQSAPF